MLLLLSSLAASACAQSTTILTVTPPTRAAVKRGETITSKLAVKIAPGFHVNSNAPLDEYLIPLRLTWQAAPLELKSTDFPAAKQEKSDFSPKPIAVFDGAFEITSKFTVPPATPVGAGFVTGKLRYQGCNATTCFPPKTIDVRLSYDVQ
ncbi:MAG: protein-disulfide reductase DsbD N-terminal domain-containing protein [Bryobacteraceae bacterium]|nr:protein-disulfide reductase DsbD N-terminal domain-containing protein [Bryobacteraceae bacterium]